MNRIAALGFEPGLHRRGARLNVELCTGGPAAMVLPMRFKRQSSVTVVHPYAWAWEPLESDPTFVLRPMFGTKAAYIMGKLVLCFSARQEPWRGILVATDHAHHESLRRDFPSLSPHPILPKWLYLPDASPRFESTAAQLVERVRRRDPRIGIEPKARKRPAKGSRPVE